MRAPDRAARRHVVIVVAVTGAEVVVELPPMDDESRDQMQQMMMRGARLEIHVVDDATQVLQPVVRDPAFAVATESWSPEGGTPHTDTYLRAADRATLERATRGAGLAGVPAGSPASRTSSRRTSTRGAPTTSSPLRR